MAPKMIPTKSLLRRKKVASRLICASSIAATLVAGSGAAKAAALTWDAGSLTDLLWDTQTNWSTDARPTTADDVFFPFAVPNPGGLANPQSITLGTGDVANSLTFSNSYSLSGGDLTLTTGLVTVDAGYSSTIRSVLHGTTGLTKNGLGTLQLRGSNDFTGPITINLGGVTIDSNAALGSDTSTVTVAGVQTRGFGGGVLTLAGSYSAGMTLSRNLSLSGGGVSGDGAAFVSVGSNTINGSITTSASVGTRFGSAFGTTTVAGSFNAGTGQTSQFMGNGNWLVTGTVTGSGSTTIVEKAGNGTAVMAGTMALTSSAELRVSAGFLRLSSGTGIAQIGVNTNSSTTGALDIRTDAPASFSSTKWIGRQSNAIFVDRANGGTGLNGNVVFSDSSVTGSNMTFAFTSRNGYGVTLTGAGGSTGNIALPTGNPTTFTNNMQGTLVLDGTLNLPNDTTARTITIGGSGDIRLTGSFTAVGANHVLAKSGAGTLTILGTSSNYLGGTSITGGTVSIANFASLNGANGSLSLNAGTLSYTGAGETTAKGINFTGTSGGTLLANQPDSATVPLVFSATALAGNATGAKTLVLGGTNKLDNEFAAPLADNGGAFALTKNGAGTWVLSGASTATGAISLRDGTLKLKGTGSLADTAAVTFDPNAASPFAGLPVFEYVGTAAGSSETIGNITVGNGIGTIKLTRQTGAASLTSLTLGSTAITRNTGGALNFVVDAAGGVNGTDAKIIVPGIAASGFIQPYYYFNNTDFASYSGTGASGFLTAVSYTAGDKNTLASGANNWIDTVTGTIAAPGTAVKTVKISGDGSKLTFSGTLLLNNGSGANGGILADSGSTEIAGGTISTGGGGELDVRVTSNSTLTISALLSSGTTGGFMKTGGGTLIVSNPGNTINPTIRLDEGTIKLSGSNLGTGTLAIRSGTYDLGGGNATHGQLVGGGKLTNSGATDSTLTVGTGANNTYSGVIEDGATNKLGITISNTGFTETFSGTASTYTGATTLTAGTLAALKLTDIGVASSIGRGTTTTTPTLSQNQGAIVFNGGTLQYTGTESVSINRLFTLAGAGTIDNTSSNGSTLIFNNSGNPIGFSGSGTRTLTLRGTSTGDNTLSPQLINNPSNPSTDTLSITKADAGLWVLGNSTNSYAGATTIGIGGSTVAGGNLRAEGAALPSASPLVFNTPTSVANSGGVLETSGDFTRSLVASAVAGSGGVTWLSGTSIGGGFAASSSKLRVAIGGVATPTDLTWGVGGFMMGTGNLVLNSTTAQAEVEVLNAINLGTAARTIQVDDNTTTTLDYAVVTGVISGGAGGALTKVGTGQLILNGANTYIGNTAVNAGTLVVSSLGNSSGTTSSSIGASGGTLTLGTGGTGATLIYAGPGETTTRPIQLASTTGTIILEASGSGPLVISNLSNTGAGAKTLTLRGINTDINRITSNLANQGANALTITKDTQTTWVLSGDNSGMTGTVSVTQGALGIGSNTALGTNTVTLGNSTLFADGGDRTLANAISMSNNTVNTAVGLNSITFNGNVTVGAGANTNTYTNSIVAGKKWIWNGQFSHGDTNGKTQAFNGSGDTELNGLVTQTSTGNLGINYSGTGSITLGGTSVTSPNSYLGTTTISSGTLILSRTLSTGAAANPMGTGPFAFNGGILKALTDYVGTTALPNAPTLGGNVEVAGSNSIQFTGTTTSSGATRTLTNSLVLPATLTLGNVTMTTSLVHAGTGTATIIGQVTGAGTLTVSGGKLILANTGTANSYTGGTTINGGTLTMGAANQIAGSVTLSPAAGTAKLDLNGFATQVNNFNSSGAGTSVVDNSSGTAVTFTIGNNNGTGTYAGTLTATGGGAISLTKIGTGAITLSGADYGGLIGGSLTVNAGTLNFTGGLSSQLAPANITVAGGATLSVANTTGQTISLGSGVFTSGTTGTTSALGFDLAGPSASDQIASNAPAVVANTVQFNVTTLAGFGLGNYTLLSAASGLSGGTYTFTGLPAGFSYSKNVSDSQVVLNVSTLATTLYWGGAVDGKWNTFNGSLLSNWASDSAGTNAGGIPTSNSSIIFSANTAVAANTTLETNFSIRDLAFNGKPTGVSPVIATGTGTNTLTITPATAGTGISIDAGGPTGATISSRLAIGADQTWNVSDSTSTLTLSGIISGTDADLTSAFVTKTGAGIVDLTTSTNTFTGNISILGGAVRAGVVGSLGAAANIVTVSGGTLVYNNVVPVQPVVLSGGALQMQGGNLTLTGQVTLTASTDSTVRVNDFATATTARTTQEKGLVTGSGNLIFDGTGISTGRGVFSLQRTTNDLSGTITIGNNVSVENKPVTSTGADAVTTGKTVGTATIKFDGTNGLFDLRDTFGSNTTVGKTLTYSTPIVFNSSGTINLDSNNTAQTNFYNHFVMGALSTTSGAAKTFTGTSSNMAAPVAQAANGTIDRLGGYLMSFPSATFAANTTVDSPNPIRIVGKTDATGSTLTKAGVGQLILEGQLITTDLAVNGGSLRLNNLSGVTPNSFSTISATGGALVVTTPLTSGTNAIGSTAVSLGAGGTLRLAPAPLSLATPGLTLSAGLDGRYFQLTGLTSGGDHGSRADTTITPTATRIDPQLNMIDQGSVVGFSGQMDGVTATNRPAGTAATNVLGMWRGFVKIDTAGMYLFNTSSDDGSMVFIDGVQVVASDVNQASSVTRSGGVYLDPGYHYFNARYSQGTGNGAMIVRWQSTDAGIPTAVPIPASNFFYTTDATTFSIANNVSVAAGATASIDAMVADTTMSGSLTIGNGGTAQLSSSTGNTLTLTGGVSIDTAGTIRTGRASSAVAGADIFSTDATISGAIGEVTAGSSFSKVGMGDLRLTGNNSFTGAVSIGVGGSLTAASNNALGLGTGASAGITIASGGQLMIEGSRTIPDRPISVGGAGIAYGTNNYSTTASAGGGAIRALSGTSSMAGAVTMTANTTFQVDAGAKLTLSNNITETGGARVLTKTGGGTLVLGGTTSVWTGNTSANAGTLVLDTNSGVTAAKLLVGYGAGLSAAVIQKSGSTVAFGTATSGQDVTSLGGTGGYGYYRNEGGSITTGQFALGGNSAGTGTTGVYEQTGGSLTVSATAGYLIWGWQGTNPNGVLNLYGGTITNNSTANPTQMGFTASVGSFGMLNILGSGALFNATAGGTSHGIALAQQTGNFAGVLNVNAGTVLTNYVRAANAGTPTYLGFGGGTLKANSANTTFVSGITAATIYSGGATIDTNSFDVTIPQALLAPTGSGVTSIPINDGGSGYIGAPAVRITGGGGTGATAIAVVDLDSSSATYGKVTGITITSAGSGYTSAPTISLIGGGSSSAATLGTAVTGTVAGGGLTKTGAGVLTLTGANTFSGPLAINGGTVSFATSTAIGDASATNTLSFNGGTLSYTGATAITPVGSRGLSVGAGGGTVNLVNAGASLTLSGGGSIVAGSGLTKSGAGTLNVSGSLDVTSGNAPVTVSGGTLNFSGTTAGGSMSVSALSVASGSTFGLLNTTPTTLNVGTLTIGAPATTTTLNIGLADATTPTSYNKIITPAAASVNGSIQLNITGLIGFGEGTYDIVQAAGGLTASGATWILSAPGGYAYTQTYTDTLVRIQAQAVSGDAYWRGDIDGSWSKIVLGTPNDTNWSGVADGSTDRLAAPSATSTVYFSASNVDLTPTTGVINTTLDGTFTINDIKFTSTPSTPTPVNAVNIAPGTGGTLTITPSASTVGIDVADSAGNVTISAPLTIGAAQTWNVTGNVNSLALTGGLNGSANVSKTGTGTLTLGGTGTYTGTISVAGGLVVAGSTINFPAKLDLAAPATFRLSGNGATLGGLAGSGIVENSSATTASTLALGASNTTSAFAGQIRNGGTAVLNVTKTGTGTLTLSGVSASSANNYTGVTAIDQGTLAFSGVDPVFTGALNFGAAANTTTVGTLDLTNTSATFGSLLAQTNSASATTINIGSGKSLTITGNVLIGGNPTTTGTTTVLNATGAGSFIVSNNAANGTFAIGGATGGFANVATADFSGLNTLTISLNTTNGTVRVNNVSTTNVTNSYSTLIGAVNTNITANNLAVGDSSMNNGGSQQINSFKLGSGATVINANTINIGNGSRDPGQIIFNGASGTVKIRNAAGSGAAALGIADVGGSTGTSLTFANAFDVRGHSADLLFSTVKVGEQNRGIAVSNTFGFDQGTMTIATLTAAQRTANASTGSGPYTTTSNLFLGGGTVSITNGITQFSRITGTTNASTTTGNLTISGSANVSIGATAGNSITMATNNTALGTATATITVTGGTTTLAGGINMSTATTAGGTATSTIDLQGGSFTLGGDILRVGGSGTSSATLTLGGGTLDMGNKNIGSATNAVTFTVTSGTLKNVASINGTGGLTKTTGGTLNVQGTNAWGGGTTVSAGNVVVTGSISGAGATVASTAVLEVDGSLTTSAPVNVSGTITGTGTIGGANGVLALGATGTASPGASLTGLGSTGALTANQFTATSGATLKLELGGTNAGAALNGYDQIVTSNAISLGGTGGTTLNLQLTGYTFDGTITPFFVLVNNGTGSVTGTFSNATTPKTYSFSGETFNVVTFGGQDFAISYDADSAGSGYAAFHGGNDIALMAIPEPGALVTLLGGLGTLLGLQRFRRRASRRD